MAGRLPDSDIEKWPEILGDVDINVVPVEYLHAVIVTLGGGKTYELRIDNNNIKTEEEAFLIQEEIANFLEEYEDYIENIDFRVDTEKVKKDIQDRTYRFMKKRK
jgi:hypothetical protein|tara:strand:+ start:12975 stop:13289 length:315 start_codon:yes stop_codon:yes gene_type:complete